MSNTMKGVRITDVEGYTYDRPLPPTRKNKFAGPQGTREEQLRTREKEMSMLAKAENLEKDKGLKVSGYISGMHHARKDGDLATITVEVGNRGAENSQRFSVKVPSAMAIGLMSKKLDIILAFTDKADDK